jgi:hypothetical protein
VELGAEPAQAVEEEPAPVQEAEPLPSVVAVHVATDPAGARLLHDDGTEACSTTPCTLEATRGSTLVLRAKLGKRRGRTAITPTQEETVLIELKATKRPQAKRHKEPTSKRPPVRSSDLKVPEWAQ